MTTIINTQIYNSCHTTAAAVVLVWKGYDVCTITPPSTSTSTTYYY